MTNRYIKLFGSFVALGLIANLIFALPAFVAPQFVVRIFDLGSLDQNVWLRHVGLLLVIISVMYIPAICDPFRYIFIAGLLVAGRLSAGVFFLYLVLFADYPRGFLIIAYTDLGLSIIQAILLFLMLMTGDPRGDLIADRQPAHPSAGHEGGKT